MLRAAGGVLVASAFGPLAVAAEGDATSGFDADIGLDPGHSRADVGASGAGVGEFEHTLDVARRVQRMLEASGLRVAMSRPDHRPLTSMSHSNATEMVRLEQEARIQAVGRVRAYVSLHFNGAGDPRTSGTETYFNVDNQGEASKSLAVSLQRALVDAMRSVGHDVADRGVKSDLLAGKPYGHFFSLRGSVPSVLAEALFLSNPTEARLLLNEDVREALAAGYARGISEYLGSPSL